jgi:hypothetical protein
MKGETRSAKEENHNNMMKKQEIFDEIQETHAAQKFREK